MGLFGPYTYKSKKTGKKYYLHMKVGRGGNIIYYFSEDMTDALWSVPAGYEVIENKAGFPFLRKKKAISIFPFGKKKEES